MCTWRPGTAGNTSTLPPLEKAGIRYLSKVFEFPGKSHSEANIKRMCLPIKASASSILMLNR